MAPPGGDLEPDDFDFDDGDLGNTSVGMELFAAQKVPDYPVISRIGGYEILGRIARGGMAEVYLARQREEDGTVQHVVVKRVLSEMQNDPAMLAMFVQEGQVAVRLFHPNVCHVYEHGEDDGMTFMALEWVYGVSLRDAIRRSSPRGLPIPVVIHIFSKVLSALEYVHHARGTDGRHLGIVHQDVTPHNVMMNWTGQVKLLDFGIAKKSGQGVEKGKGPQGKYEYMSPEQVRGKPVDPRSDVFALGVCLYEALTCTQLYARGGIPATMTAIVEEPPPSLEKARPGLPTELDRIVRKALAKDPAARWSSAKEMQAALDSWLVANHHVVNDQRVSLALGTLFTPAEKSPLPPQGAQFTGTLAAMTSAAAERVLAGKPGAHAEGAESWTESFEHSAGGSEPPPGLEIELEGFEDDASSSAPATFATAPKRDGAPNVERGQRPRWRSALVALGAVLVVVLGGLEAHWLGVDAPALAALDALFR